MTDEGLEGLSDKARTIPHPTAFGGHPLPQGERAPHQNVFLTRSWAKVRGSIARSSTKATVRLGPRLAKTVRRIVKSSQMFSCARIARVGVGLYSAKAS